MTELARALRRKEFVLHYQPQVDVRTGGIVAVEALVRWLHPDRGLVAPAHFIPLAEKTGLIVPLGAWVLADACRQARAWHGQGLPGLRVAVNLSARQLGDGSLVSKVEDAIREAGIEASSLELEITESLVARDPEQAVRLLRELCASGVRLMVDDFGTGYSSLAHLKRFPVDGLKIDRAFVRNLPEDRSDASITRAVISMAHELGLCVVAEGVESSEQLRFLRENGCELVQGYLFGAPMPAEELPTAVARHEARRACGDPALVPG